MEPSTPTHNDLKQGILELLARRPASSTICPSEVVRALHPTDWRSLMDEVRTAAAELVAEGKLEITQAGKVVPPESARGPIRLRLPQ